MGKSAMMEQYLITKSQYQDCVLFYRLGDFYEMFYDDAIRVSKMLDLTLTSRDAGDGKAPMCGVPYHAAEVYIAKLVALGEKVAICEQVEAPQKGKIVKREIARIVSAGTITENTLLNDKENNFIASVSLEDGYYSIAWADITTGEFFVESFKILGGADVLCDYLVKCSPAQIICSQNVYLSLKDSPVVIHAFFQNLNFIKSGRFLRFTPKLPLKNILKF
jgi:DNA mismatch repair protein MutS